MRSLIRGCAVLTLILALILALTLTLTLVLTLALSLILALALTLTLSLVLARPVPALVLAHVPVLDEEAASTEHLSSLTVPSAARPG